MAEIKAEKEAAYQWLEKELLGYNWSMHTYDRNCMVDRTDNNASECFNSWILAYRDRPCLTMLEEIKCRLMKRFTKRRNEAATWKSPLTPKVLKHLDKKSTIAQKMIVQASSDLNFQVMDKSYYPARRFVVMLESRKCDCGYWEIVGLPCAHVMAAMGYARHDVQEYVPMCFSKQAYLSTYSLMFNLTPDQCTWEPTERPLIDPPIVQRKIGRSCTLRPSVAKAARARKNNSNASPITNQPLNASQQRMRRRKQASASRSIASGQPTTASSQALRSSQPVTSYQPATASSQALRKQKQEKLLKLEQRKEMLDLAVDMLEQESQVLCDEQSQMSQVLCDEQNGSKLDF
ncbi:hypothetical protein WN944_010907 [Citrus x changshan-huyou]|uniref:SWIM-type domain-containing protein n=1 Tax=Citrus x changshan-huyou TaxID=2935761 RepID=A0AAP0MV03_9ROSI